MKPKPNPAVAIPSIMSSKDKAFLNRFRARIFDAEVPEIVAAIDKRLEELDENELRLTMRKPVGDLTFVERVEEAIRVYEQFLAIKHGGKRISASRTRGMIKRWGAEEAVRRTVINKPMSTGLDLLDKYKRLDCAYEQIILDFHNKFDPAVVAKAHENLERLKSRHP